MQLVLTEKQFKKLALQFNEDELISEEGDDAAAAAPESGTSSDGENKTGASKWESGATRGPGNQIGVTKWSDVVGSTLQRSKGNQLKELFKTIERFTDDGRLVRVRDIFVVHQGIRMGNPVFKISKNI